MVDDISDEEREKMSPFERHDRLFKCPVHGLKYRRKSKGQYGGYFCAGKKPDGIWCNWHITDRQMGQVPIVVGEPEEFAQATEHICVDRFDYNDYYRRHLSHKWKRQQKR